MSRVKRWSHISSVKPWKCIKIVDFFFYVEMRQSRLIWKMAMRFSWAPTLSNTLVKNSAQFFFSLIEINKNVWKKRKISFAHFFMFIGILWKYSQQVTIFSFQNHKTVFILNIEYFTSYFTSRTRFSWTADSWDGSECVCVCDFHINSVEEIRYLNSLRYSRNDLTIKIL